MRYILENDTLRVEIESFGAEIKSVKRKADGREYMWCGDPEYWGRTSPVLFPFVGAPKNKEYRYEGRTYSMGQHGFARDMEFALEAQEGKSIWFVLASTEETYVKYPFRFRLHIGYMLDENEVSVHWKVDNTDEKPMYFSIGARSQMRDRSQILKAVFLLLQRIIRCGSSLHLNLLRLNLERLLHLRGCDKLTRHDDCRADV